MPARITLVNARPPSWPDVRAAAQRVIDACDDDVTPTVLGSELAALMRAAGLDHDPRPATGDILDVEDIDRLPAGSAIVAVPAPPHHLPPAGALLRMPEGWRAADDGGEVHPPGVPGTRFRVLFVGDPG